MGRLNWLVGALLAASLLAVAQPEPSMLLAGVAAVTVAALLGARYLAVRIVSRTLRIGRRSGEHREPLSVIASPRHPDTAGRPRPRAPTRPVAVA